MAKRLLAGLVVALLAAGGVAYATRGGGYRAAPATATRVARTPIVRRTRPKPRIEVWRSGTLAAPLQDRGGGERTARRVLLLGGLTASDTSTDRHRAGLAARSHGTVGRASARRVTTPPRRASAQLVYLFGGGNGVAQLDQILRVDPSAGGRRAAGRLPAASSDSGGRGDRRHRIRRRRLHRHALARHDRRLAARAAARSRRAPSARRCATRPSPRAGSRLVIAGGSLQDGTASTAVYEFTPAARHCSRIGRLPAPTTHAAAAALGGVASTSSAAAAHARYADRPRSSPSTRHAARPRRRLLARAALRPGRGPLGDRILVAGGRTRRRDGRVVASSSAPRRRRSASPQPPRPRAPRTSMPHDGANDAERRRTRSARPLVYVPNSQSDTVDVIDPHTLQGRRALRGRRAAAARRARAGTCARSTSRTTPATA